MRTLRISDPRLKSVHKPNAKRYGSFHHKQLLGMLEKHTTYACSVLLLFFFLLVHQSRLIWRLSANIYFVKNPLHFWVGLKLKDAETMWHLLSYIWLYFLQSYNCLSRDLVVALFVKKVVPWGSLPLLRRELTLHTIKSWHLQWRKPCFCWFGAV